MKKKKSNFTKEYQRPYQRKYNNRKPKIRVSAGFFTYEDLKKCSLIDSKTFREYLRRKIDSDFNGGDVNE